MKYITLIIGLLVVGCGTPVKELTLEEKVVGTYEVKVDSGGLFKGATLKLVLHENGNGELSVNGSKSAGDNTWKIVGKEVHLGSEKGAGGRGGWAVFKIEPNGELSWLGEIDDVDDGKLREFPKEERPPNFRKIR